MAREAAQIPFDYRAATLRLLDRRALIEGLRTLDLLAARHDVTLVHPLLDRQFVASWARLGGRLGATSRTASMTTLFGALLPAEICARRSKAVFNSAIFGAHARSFAEQWDGGNVDPDLVDPELLRAEWLSERPHGGSLPLLQQAYFGPHPTSAIA
jgi:asparagine synthase (glutamine-hydrolysing)